MLGLRCIHGKLLVHCKAQPLYDLMREVREMMWSTQSAQQGHEAPVLKPL